MHSVDTDIDFQIIEWWAQDTQTDTDTDSECSCEIKMDNYLIRCFGVTKSGMSVTCAINNFKPYYYVKVHQQITRTQFDAFLRHIDEKYYYLKDYRCTWYKGASDTSHTRYCQIKNVLARDHSGKHLSTIVVKKDLFGFNNGKTYKFIKLVFNSYNAMLKSRYAFKNAVQIESVSTKPVKYKLYESNFEPFMRYCHMKDILMAGWIRLPKGKYTLTKDTANTQIEASIDHKNVVSLRDVQDMGRLLQASWDIEVYSEDDSFPDPRRPANVVYQIATTYKYYNDNDILVKHLLTLKTCARVKDPMVIVECCKDERDLIRRWLYTINMMDPDIMYTYNGDSFDCRYLKERANMTGLSKYMFEMLSRLKQIPAYMKTEYFSSSAYGDSEFHRVYIPGRLNYDLLIHYKRGMKKYPSYKLDYIANEILKVGKHDVSAKDMFRYFASGDPEKIKIIAEYCIQDTYLLQRLVDTQLILTNIIQLANVTFVPIGYLTTRGQTIKVFSQVLRKASQMGFLVPHTNFNENTFPVQLQCARPHYMDTDDVGKYIFIEYGKNKRMDAKVCDIISDTELVVLCSTELEESYTQAKFVFEKSTYFVLKMWPSEDTINDSFTGATVLEPLQGHYTDNVAVLDFASLYPCVEISRNLCYSTLVMDPKYLDIPGVKYETVSWNDKVEYKLKHTCGAIGKSGKSKGQVCGKQAYFIENGEYYCRIHDPKKKLRSDDEKYQKRDETYSFTIVQPHTDEHGNVVNKGVVPAMLEELYSERKKVKVQMAKAAESGNKLLEDILNSTQLAIKVSLNSTYGFVSRNRGNLILKPLGQLTTAIGRMLIEQSKGYAEGDFKRYVNGHKLVTQVIKTEPSGLDEQAKQKVLKKYAI